MAVVLGDDAAALGVALHGHVIAHRVAADDGGAGMHALAAHVALDGAGRVDDGLNVLVGVVGLLQVGIGVQGLVDGDAQLVADHLADAVAQAVGRLAGHVGIEPLAQLQRARQNAGRVAHGIFRLQGAEGDDLGHMVLAVDLLDVVDDLFAAALLEVDVDIGHLHALGREKTLEQQAVGQRVQIGDAHGIGHDSAGSRAATRTHADALGAGPLDVLLHDEEVGREALLDDDAHLVVGALLGISGHRRAVALLQPLLHARAEPRLLGLSLRQGEARQD